MFWLFLSKLLILSPCAILLANPFLFCLPFLLLHIWYLPSLEQICLLLEDLFTIFPSVQMNSCKMENGTYLIIFQGIKFPEKWCATLRSCSGFFSEFELVWRQNLITTIIISSNYAGFPFFFTGTNNSL